jgi:hypothetical protein
LSFASVLRAPESRTAATIAGKRDARVFMEVLLGFVILLENSTL